MTDFVELRGRMAALWEIAHGSTPPDQWPVVTMLTTGPGLDKVPEGMTAWAVGPWADDPSEAPEGRLVVVLPSLDFNASPSIWRRYLARVIATATGRCPLCSQVAGLDREPPAPGEPGRAAWHVLPLFVRLNHSRGCPADGWTDAERQYFPIFQTRPDGEEKTHREGLNDD